MSSKSEKEQLLTKRRVCLTSALIMVFAFDPVLLGQVLQITAPANGAIFSPGQSINVVAIPMSGTSFTHVVAIGESPIGFSEIATGSPFQFSLSIPSSIAVGRYRLIAVGLAGAPQEIYSDPITIDVERGDVPSKLTAIPLGITFESQGQMIPVHISGTFAGEGLVDVTRSSYLNYSSSNASVATVDSNGLVTAVGAGAASVTAAYGNGLTAATVTIPVTVLPPALTVSPTSQTFPNQPVSTTSPNQSLTLKNAGKNALRILGVTPVGDFAETDNCVSPTPLPSGSTCTINVTFLPTAIGVRPGAINITDSLTPVPVSVSLSGTGVPVDASPPISRVLRLRVLGLSISFPVQWSGSAAAGIQDYTIYVSDNGGPFTAWLTNTTATQGTYTGVNGHGYAFYSIARDLVGNVENAKTAAEATTTVEAPPVTTTAQFSDVAPTATYFDAANLMFLAGVTTGCVPTSDPSTRMFCPNDNVTREQMAAFIVRAVTGTTTPALYNLTPYFADVPMTNPFFPHIQKLEELGVTTGCGSGLFCPTDSIPRWEMAIFMVRARLALYGATFTTATTPYFADVPTNVEGNGMPFPFIQRSYEEHITNGCGANPLMYCPDELVTRGQMASFIMRGLFNETMVLGPTDPLLTGVTPTTMDTSVGSQINVTITGFNTNFKTGDTVTVPSGMLAVSNVMVNSATSISATLTAKANVVAGPQALVVTTGGQSLTLPLAIQVGTY